MKKYMVKGYNKYGNHVFTDYAACLVTAVRIRKQFALGFNITTPALMPTIWKKGTDGEYTRVLGY